MYNNKKILGIITARGGSKGIPRKNIQILSGKPLIAWTIIEAQKSQYIDKIILSSDDKEIIDISKQWGCEVPFVRPKKFAKDDTSSVIPVLHAVQQLPGFDYIVLLQPTSPLRSVEDIDGCIDLCFQKNSNICVSVTSSTINSFLLCKITKSLCLEPFLQEGFIPRRQDTPELYIINGAVYVAKIDWLKQTQSFLTPETMAYVMPQIRSLDIDTELDMKICEQLLKNI